MSKDDFKIFARSHPELVNYIKNGEMTWQKFYEIFDIYGDDKNAWEPYTKKVNNTSNFTNIFNSIDTDSIQKHINTAQKAIGVVQELASKGKTGVDTISKVGPKIPRPINKFFED